MAYSHWKRLPKDPKPEKQEPQVRIESGLRLWNIT